MKAASSQLTVIGVVLFAVAGFLLLSVGGIGVVAAPVTLPLMFLVARRRPTRGFRIAGALIGGLTAAELAWGLVYVAAGEVRPLIWLVPAIAAVATAAGFLKLGRAGPRRTRVRRRSPGGPPPPSTARAER